MCGLSAAADSRVQIKLENVAIANALQLEAARRRVSCSVLFLASFVLLFRSFRSKFDIAIGFSHLHLFCK